GNLLDDGAQDNVTAVRVLLLCSRFELQGLVCKQWQEIFQSSEAVLWDGFKLRPKEVAYPGLHLEQLADRDFRGRVVIRIIRQVLSEPVIKREFPLLCELSNRDLSEGLVDRSEIELGIDSVGHVVFFARKPVGLLKHHAVLLSDEHRSRKLIGPHHLA